MATIASPEAFQNGDEAEISASVVKLGTSRTRITCGPPGVVVSTASRDPSWLQLSRPPNALMRVLDDPTLPT